MTVTAATLVANRGMSHYYNPWNARGLIVQVLLSLHGAAIVTHVRNVQDHFSNFQRS
jgi:hypothetical protein